MKLQRCKRTDWKRMEERRQPMMSVQEQAERRRTEKERLQRQTVRMKTMNQQEETKSKQNRTE